MPKLPDLATRHVSAGPWLPVWALIFQAADDLRRSRAEMEAEEAGKPDEQRG